jgi:DNA-binding transcriptional MerR regulator
MNNKYSIGEAAKITGVSTRTIRFYVEIGLLNCLTNADNNYRFFSENDLRRLEQILLFKSFGFSLEDIRLILSSTSNEAVDKVFNDNLANLKAKISDLCRRKEVLEAISKIYMSNGLEYLKNPYIIKELSYMNNVFIKTFNKLDTELQVMVLTELYHTGSLSHETLKSIGIESGSRTLSELHMIIIKSILNQVDRSAEKNIVKNLEKTDFKLSEEIKSALFTFDDVIMLPDKAIEKWLLKCDDRDLAIALKESSKYIKIRIFSNMPAERISKIKGLMDGSVEYKLYECYTSMTRLVSILQQMDFSGEITIHDIA